MHIESLESRIAPATLTGKTLTWTDVDQDAVTLTIKTTAEISSSLFEFDTPFASTGAQILRTIAMSGKTELKGASITVTVDKAEAGDGNVDIGSIDASGVDLKSITTPGDLGGIKVGSGTSKVALKSLSIGSLGVHAQQTLGTSSVVISDLAGGVGKITIAGDIGKSLLNVTSATANIGSLSIGGDVRGELNLTKVSRLTVVGSLDGIGDGVGSLSALSIGVASIGGIKGGEFNDGKLNVQSAKNLTIKGDVVGGTSPGTGNIQLGTVKTMTIEGDIAGTIFNSAEISIQKSAKTIVVTGSLNGGNLSAASANKVNIGGNLDGSVGEGGGSLTIFENLGQLVVGGDLKGGSLPGTGVIDVSGKIGKLLIEGDLVGGTVGNSGSVFATDSIGDVTIKGGIFGGNFEDTGVVSSLNGSIGRVRVEGSITDDQHVNAGRVQSRTGISSVTVIGNFGGTLLTEGKLGPVRIDGSIVGTASDRVIIAAQNSITGLSVKADASFLDVDAGSFLHASGNPDAKIGSIKIGGTATALNVLVGISPGDDGIFGSSDDILVDPSGGGKGVASIASLTIGQIAATAETSDSFAIVAEQIGKIIVGGTSTNLAKGARNDLFSVSVSGDLIAFEVPPA